MVIGIMGAMPEEVAQLCEKLSGVEKEKMCIRDRRYSLQFSSASAYKLTV